MRSGGYTLHHSLTLEAASIVKQALTLARRRGHSQVTPLHVASAMLASPTALLKGACLKSHSHPLQCKALELCFNVALNRLPTSASSPLLGPQSHLPSLSNALVAAFKRAQAHQRRGSIESQQQPILALKVEVEQLVISILDDPSVSRVMREAGFSSTQVKANVEQAVTLDKSQSPILTPQSKESKMLLLGNNISQTQITTPPLSQFKFPSSISTTKTTHSNEVLSVLEAMTSKKTRNSIIVGECQATNESIINGVIERINRNDVAPELKSLQFISVPLSTLKSVSKEEFEIKIGELRSLMKSYVSRGVVLYLGDLDWVSGFWARFGEQRSVFFCPVEYMIMELSRLACGSNGESKRVWIMGFASSQTYAKCRIGRPSLEALWSLHPLTVPAAGTLALSLSLHSGMHEEVKKEPLMEDYRWLSGIKKNLICCSDCSENFMKEAEAVSNGEKELITAGSSSRLPSWLQQYKDIEDRKQLQESDGIKDLCKKWNSICNSVHRKPHFLEKVFNISSSSPSSSSSLSSNRYKAQKTWPTIFERSELGDVSKPAELLSNPNSSPNSASSSEASGDLDFDRKFDELNPENVRLLTNALENKAPWQGEIVAGVVSTVLKCRSGMMRSHRQDSWLLFSGDDSVEKETAARELAKAVFGTRDDESFVAVGASGFAPTRADPTEEVSNSTRKRARDERGGSVFDRFSDAVRCNPSRVFCIGDADRIDDRCVQSFERAMRDGSVSAGEGEEVLLKDAIVVFSCESRAGKREKEEREEEEQCGILLDLNVATEDSSSEDGDGIGILGSVDMRVVFKSPNVVN